MAAVLFSLEPYSPTLSLHSDTLLRLQATFSTSHHLTPILTCGNSQFGKSSLLHPFLPPQFLDTPLDEDSVFTSPENLQAVLVWPEPVFHANRCLLLMKMYGFSPTEADEITKKLLFVLFSGTAVNFICFEPSNLTFGVEFLEKIYLEMSEKTGLKTANFFIFVESQKKIRKNLVEEIMQKTRFEVFFRGRNELPESTFQSILGVFEDTNRFILYENSRNQVLTECKSSEILSFLSTLQWMTNIANSDEHYSTLVSISPSFQFENIAFAVETILENARYYGKLREIRTVKMLDGLSDEELYRNIIVNMQPHFDFTQPIVILAVLGFQGVGKSTLLNQIIEYCAGRRLNKELFLTKNASIHATRDSEFLPFPIKMPGTGHQLMLVDVQGLYGLETSDLAEAKVVDNLLTAVLTVISVPCIVIMNQQGVGEYIERLVENLVTLKRNFGFKVERIVLLFHDKDPGQVNPDVERLISTLNQGYFSGLEVIKLLSKPNFSDPSKSILCHEFISRLISLSDFPKRTTTGESINLKDLINSMIYIIKRDKFALTDIGLSATDRQEKRTLYESKNAELTRIYDELTAGNEENIDLMDLFSGKALEFLTNTDTEMRNNVKSNVKHMVEIQLRMDILEYKSKLETISPYSRIVKNMEIEDLKGEIKSHLEYCFHTECGYFEFHWNLSLNFTYEAFDRRAQTLQTKLLEVKRLYPKLRWKAEAGLRCAQEVTANLENAKVSTALATSLMYSTLGIGGGTLMLKSLCHPLYTRIPSIHLIKYTGSELVLAEPKKLSPLLINPVISIYVLAGSDVLLLQVVRTLIHTLCPLNHFTDESFSTYKSTQLFDFQYWSSEGRIPLVIISHKVEIGQKHREYWRQIRFITALFPAISVTLCAADLAELNTTYLNMISQVSSGPFPGKKCLFHLTSDEKLYHRIKEIAYQKQLTCHLHASKELRSVTDLMPSLSYINHTFPTFSPSPYLISTMKNAVNQANSESMAMCDVKWTGKIQLSATMRRNMVKMRLCTGEMGAIGVFVGLGEAQEVDFVNEFARKKAKEPLLNPFSESPWVQFLSFEVKNPLLSRILLIYINTALNETEKFSDLLGKLLKTASFAVFFDYPYPKSPLSVLETAIELHKFSDSKPQILIETSDTATPSTISLLNRLVELNFSPIFMSRTCNLKRNSEQICGKLEEVLSREEVWGDVASAAAALEEAF